MVSSRITRIYFQRCISPCFPSPLCPSQACVKGLGVVGFGDKPEGREKGGGGKEALLEG